MSFVWRDTKQSQTKVEFVQTNGQAVMHGSYWLNLKHCSSSDGRLQGPVLPASMFNVLS